MLVASVGSTIPSSFRTAASDWVFHAMFPVVIVPYNVSTPRRLLHGHTHGLLSFLLLPANQMVIPPASFCPAFFEKCHSCSLPSLVLPHCLSRHWDDGFFCRGDCQVLWWVGCTLLPTCLLPADSAYSTHSPTNRLLNCVGITALVGGREGNTILWLHSKPSSLYSNSESELGIFIMSFIHSR